MMFRAKRNAVKVKSPPQIRKVLGGTEGNPQGYQQGVVPSGLGEGAASNGPWSFNPMEHSLPLHVAAGHLSQLDKLLKEDRQNREKQLDLMKWFHINTSRNLAEIKLKDGKDRPLDFFSLPM